MAVFRGVRGFAGALGVIALISCHPERALRETPPGGSAPAPVVRQVELQPGPKLPDRQISNPYAGDAHATAAGERLYNWYNCSGCHFAGGGGIGPPLMDDRWIYGSNPENIYSVIVEGRPNGMPAYGGRIPEYQVWQIIAYVRSLSGLDNGVAGPRPERLSIGAAPPEAKGKSDETPSRETTHGSGEPARR